MAIANSSGVFDVSNYNNFEVDIEAAKNLIKKDLKNNDLHNDNNVKFIYDRGFHFFGLGMKTPEGDYVIPIKDRSYASFKKGMKKTSKEVAETSKNTAVKNKKSGVILGGSVGLQSIAAALTG